MSLALADQARNSSTVAGRSRFTKGKWQRRELVRGVAGIAQFDAAVRKLLPELQARLQRFHENWIFCFRDPVDFYDVTFESEVSGEVVPHENLP